MDRVKANPNFDWLVDLASVDGAWPDDPDQDDEFKQRKQSAWLTTIEPIEFADQDTFDEEFRKANLDAVGKQMNRAKG